MLDHHFGNHLYCQSKEEGGWCKYKGCPELIKQSRQDNHYHDRNTDNALYMLVLKIWEHFGSDVMLEQIYHQFQSQKSESLHQQVTCVGPKDKHFSGSMSLSDCVALVVITDSVGYEDGMKMIFHEIGFKVPPVTLQYMLCRNKHRRYDQEYHQCLDVKSH